MLSNIQQRKIDAIVLHSVNKGFALTALIGFCVAKFLGNHLYAAASFMHFKIVNLQDLGDLNGSFISSSENKGFKWNREQSKWMNHIHWIR